MGIQGKLHRAGLISGPSGARRPRVEATRNADQSPPTETMATSGEALAATQEVPNIMARVQARWKQALEPLSIRLSHSRLAGWIDAILDEIDLRLIINDGYPMFLARDNGPRMPER